MTEAEWVACEEPALMLAFLHHRASGRKLQLFACACCRQIWHLITDTRSRSAVEVAERYAADLATPAELRLVDEQAAQAVRDAIHSRQTSEYNIPEMFTTAARAAWFAATPDADLDTASAVISAYSLLARSGNTGLGPLFVVKKHCSLLARETFGNPFRPVTIDPSWVTSTVIALARGIYEERAFDRMPILADALQDAGCENEDMLSHCRGEGTHVRGCWVVDLVLGKE